MSFGRKSSSDTGSDTRALLRRRGEASSASSSAGNAHERCRGPDIVNILYSSFNNNQKETPRLCTNGYLKRVVEDSEAGYNGSLCARFACTTDTHCRRLPCQMFQDVAVQPALRDNIELLIAESENRLTTVTAPTLGTSNLFLYMATGRSPITMRQGNPLYSPFLPLKGVHEEHARLPLKMKKSAPRQPRTLMSTAPLTRSTGRPSAARARASRGALARGTGRCRRTRGAMRRGA